MLWFIPSLIDKRELETVRTGFPFVYLGLMVGTLLVRKNHVLNWWIVCYLGLITLVLVAEAGQLFLPYRSFDWYDIAWGAIGAFIGLFMSAIVAFILKFLENRKS